jgi:hypothetical protein
MAGKLIRKSLREVSNAGGVGQQRQRKEGNEDGGGGKEMRFV